MHTSGYFDAMTIQHTQQPVSNVIEFEVYGTPITVTELPNNYYRVAAWVPGEQHRTRPLVEERFSYNDFRAAVMEVARNINPNHIAPGTGPNEMFIFTWGRKHLRTIEEASRRRTVNASSFTDLGDANTVPTRTFRGEDGRIYEDLDIRGEDTDPVLIHAIELKRKQEEETARRAKEAAERQVAAMQELEGLPGYGSF